MGINGVRGGGGHHKEEFGSNKEDNIGKDSNEN